MPDEASGDLWVIDPRTYEITDRYHVGASAQHVTPDWDLQRLYVECVFEGNGRLVIIDPMTGAPGEPSVFRLSSAGRSQYREIEFGAHFTGRHGIDVNASYVRSQAKADLNSFTSFYDAVLWPIVGINQYTIARTDAPHRMLLRARAMPSK